MKQILFDQLIKHVEEKNYITISYGEELIQCIAIKATLNFVLILRFLDFWADGYEIIDLNKIDNILISDSAKYFKKIVMLEGAKEHLANAPNICLKTWQDIFVYFQVSGEIIIVENEREGYINIGKVLNVSQKEFFMQCFSPNGIWDDEIWSELINKTSNINFRTHYTKTFAKYLRNK